MDAHAVLPDSPPSPRRAARRRLVASATGVAASVAVVAALATFAGEHGHQFLFVPVLTVSATALVAGTAPALAATAAAIATAAWLLFEPAALRDPFELLRLGGVAAVCAVVSFAAGSVRTAYRRARRERAAALRASERLARQKRETERAVVLRDEVLAVVSHDLKSPLATIAVIADVLERKHVKQLPDLARHVSSIRQCVDSMNRLVLDLLDVASIEAGRLSLRPRREDAAEIAGEALARVQPVADAAGVATALHAPAVVLHCDGQRIVQVLSNLLSNAVKATPAGGRVELRVDEDGGAVRFAVVDTGRGIDAEDLPHVFARFRRGRSAAYAGSGLGLAIAKGIVEAHGGAIRAESRVGAGSRFEFTVPRGA
jgi:signal transduction histidine kinase